MDPCLQVVCVFRMLTPLYGLACVDPMPPPDGYTVYSHPAPVPLIEELLPPGHRCREVVLAASTAEAAAMARQDPTAVALTTAPAAQRNGLHVFSRQRCIEMVWTVFAATRADRVPVRAALPAPTQVPDRLLAVVA